MSIVPPRKRRSYTAEYKVEAAHRVIDSGRTVAEVARELGIDAGMLRCMGQRREAQDRRRRGLWGETPGDGRAGRAPAIAQAGSRVREGQLPLGKSLGVLCRDAEESPRFDLMVKYAGPDPPADTDAATADRATRFSVRRMARLLGVSTSGYYAHAKRAAATVLTPRQQRRADLGVKILDMHTESDGTYGSPRITAELRERGETVNAKTVAAIMAEIGIEGI